MCRRSVPMVNLGPESATREEARAGKSTRAFSSRQPELRDPLYLQFAGLLRAFNKLFPPHTTRRPPFTAPHVMFFATVKGAKG